MAPWWGQSPVGTVPGRMGGGPAPVLGGQPAVRRSTSAVIRRESTFDSPSAAIVTP